MLDPRINQQGFLADYTDEPELLADVQERIKELEEHYKIHYASKVTLQTSEPTEVPASSNWSFIDRYSRRPVTTRDELREYFRLIPEDFATTDPIAWWAARKAQFPNLSKLARNILAIPGALFHSLPKFKVYVCLRISGRG